MKRLLTICCLLLCTGCVLPAALEDWWTAHPDPVPDIVMTSTTSTSTTTAPSGDIQGTHGYLWKPASESRQGRCAFLLPCDYRQEAVRDLYIGAERVAERRGGYANGNRIHFFGAKTGAAYGSNVKVKVLTVDGSADKTWTIANGAVQQP